MAAERATFLRLLRTQCILLLAALVASELLLQVASGASLTIRRVLAPPWDVDFPVISDPRLVFRGNPLNRQHDAAGYHNARRLTKADIAVLGDSVSYGMSGWRMAWPHLLSLETGRSVYNMSLPGYGPGQSLLQLDEALSLSPSLVIVAPYLGNDFYDTYELALRHPDLAESLPAALREAAAARERLKPLEQEVFPLFELGQPPATPTPSVARRLLSEHVKLYGLLRALRHRFITDRTPDPLLSRKFSTAARSLTPLQRQFASAFDAPGWRTILTAPYRGRVLDDRDPRIRLGFEIARRAVRTIGERCRAAGVDLLVVLLPTKESVFWPQVPAPDVHPGLRQLIFDEERLRQEWIADLRASGVAYLDAQEALRAAPNQPYHEDADGHPNETGQRIIAAAVAARVKEMPRRK